MKKRKTDKQRINYIENQVNEYKLPVIFWPEGTPHLKGYFATTCESTVRDCIDKLIDRRKNNLEDLLAKIKAQCKPYKKS